MSVRARRCVVAVLLCLVGVATAGFVGVGAAASAGEGGLTGERTLNETGPDPGETVRVTTTVIREGEGAIDYVDAFDPAVERSELVSVTEGGEEISPSLEATYPDTVILSVEEVGPEVVEFVYDITVPADASHGETVTFDGTVQADEETEAVGGVSSFTVGGEPFFAVELDPVEPVTVGEELGVEATVTNTGESGGEQSVTFAVDGEEQASTPVELDGGESETVTFEYTTAEADIPEVDLAVSSADETATATVGVVEPAAFDVVIEAVPASVTAGDELVLAAVVTNTGDETGTETVTFDVDGESADTQEVTLDGGENETVTFEYTTTEADTPEVDVAVSSADETATTTVGVVEPAAFEVALEPVESVTAGDELVVAAVVTNTGDETGTETVTFDVDGESEGSQEVTLAGGESETVEFEYTTTETDPPAVDVAVSSADETDVTDVEVRQPAALAVAFGSQPPATPVGEVLAVEVVVTNTGDETGTETVTFDVDDETKDSQEVTLPGGENETVTFEYTTTETDPPAVDVAASSADETVTATVTVPEEPFLAVELDPVESLTAGDELVVEGLVTNTGAETGTGTLTFAVDEETVDTTEITLDGGESETVTFEYATTGADPPAVDVAVSSGDETATATVGVVEPAAFEVELSAAEPVPAGESLSVEATVTNTGGVTDTQTVTITAGETTVAERAVTLAGGESETVGAEYATASADIPSVDIEVATADATATATATVLEPAAVTVTLVTVDEPVVAGEDLVVEYAVENTGEVTATREVTLGVDGETVATDTVTLAGGERETVTTAHPTTEGGVTLEVTVTAAQDSESVQVTVGTGEDSSGTETGSDDESGPGFGPVAAVLGLGVFCLLARSRA